MTTPIDERREVLTVTAHMRGKPSREQNASDTEPVEMVATRSTQEAVVVAVDGHPHTPALARKDP